MKLPVRILLAILCAALVLAMPFVLSAPNLLGEVKWELWDELGGEDEGWLMRLLPVACAEEETDDTIREYDPLPLDFTPGYEANPADYTEWGYEDATIRVQLETREEYGTVIRIAWVDITSPTQLRTAIAGKKVTSSAEALVQSIAKGNNAVIAVNGDYYTNDPGKTTFEYRMAEKVRAKTNRKKDNLIIDENGDFHTFIQSQGVMEFEEQTGHQIIQAFTFGPTLVKEGQLMTIDKEYGYDPNGKTARTAIGQIGPLSYVLVVAEGRQNPEKGLTQQQLANFMYELGCVEAFNLDGGGSATMYFDGKYYNKLMGGDRQMSDILYFATAVPPEEWKE